MFTTSGHNFLPSSLRLSALFSRSSSSGSDSHSTALQPSESPLHAMEDDPSLSSLEPFSNPRLSDVLEEVSELFKSASLGSESAHGACRPK